MGVVLPDGVQRVRVVSPQLRLAQGSYGMPPARLLSRVREAGVMLIVNMQVVAVEEDSIRVIETAGGRREVEKRTIVHALA